MFRDIVRRIEVTRALTADTRRLEYVKSMAGLNGLDRSNTQSEDHRIWKHAVSLRLRCSIRDAKILMGMATTSMETKQNLQMAIDQMTRTLRTIEEETNYAALEQLRKNQYTFEAVNKYKVFAHRMMKACMKSKLQVYFDALKRLNPKKLVKSLMAKPSQPPPPQQPPPTTASIYDDESKFFGMALNIVSKGQVIIKCHMTSNGRDKRYLKLFKDGILRWANNEKDIMNPKKGKSCNDHHLHGTDTSHRWHD
jgi:hypothetical protein